MIKFNCTCGQPLQVGDDLAGKKARCPFCYKVLNVPAPESVPATAPPATAGKPAAAEKVEIAPKPPRAPATAGKPSREQKPGVSPLPYVAVVVIALAIVAGILLWWNLSTAPGPSPAVPEKQVAVKVVPPALPPPAPTPEKAIPPKPPAEKPGKAPVPVKPPTPAPSPVQPPAPLPLSGTGKVTIEPAPTETAFQPGQIISREIGSRIEAIVIAQLRQIVNMSMFVNQPVREGTKLKATVEGIVHEGEVFKPFNVYVRQDGTVTVKRFYVKTTSPWKLDKEVTIPAGILLQLGEDNRYSVADLAKPPATAGKPAPPPPAARETAPTPVPLPQELSPEPETY